MFSIDKRGERQTIEFVRVLNLAERNYTVIDMELLSEIYIEDEVLHNQYLFLT